MPPLLQGSKGWLRATPEATLLLPRTVFAGEGCGPLGRTLGDINSVEQHSESDLILQFWGSVWTDSLGLSVMALTLVNSSLAGSDNSLSF